MDASPAGPEKRLAVWRERVQGLFASESRAKCNPRQEHQVMQGSRRQMADRDRKGQSKMVQ